MLDPRTHTFLEVYRRRSFTRTAEELHLSQPAVSQHIRWLEERLDARLFVKQGRAVTPTRAADILYLRLSCLENDDARITAEVRAAADEAAEMTLRFGATRTIADYVMPRILPRQLDADPDVRLTMVVGNTNELVTQLDRGDIDVALVEGPFDCSDFEGTALSTEPYIAIGSRGERAGDLAALLERRIIVRESGSGTREILERNLAARDLSLADFAGAIEIGSIAAIKACVEAGGGISFLYRVAANDELARGSLSDVTPSDLTISHDFTLIWQRGSIYSGRFRALADTWRSWLSDIT